LSKKIYKATVEFSKEYEFNFTDEYLREGFASPEEGIKWFIDNYLSEEQIPESFVPKPVGQDPKEYIKIEIIEASDEDYNNAIGK